MRFLSLPAAVLSALLFSANSAFASMVELDARGQPITSTTTKTVMAYVTETVYIYPNLAGTTVTTTVHASPTAAAGTTTTAAATTPTSFVLVVQPTTTSSSSASSSAKVSTSTSAATSTKTSSSSAAAATTTAAGIDLNRPLISAYYPDWVESTLSPEQIDWNRIDWVDFAFAILDSNLNLVFTGWNSDDLLKRTVKLGHAAGKKVKLSIGGWTGSAYFSTAVATAAGRQNLATKMLNIYNQYGLDGIDIDWEYPGIPGQSGNRYASGDSANYLVFLQLLRATLPTGAKITAATQVWPFAGTDSQPLSDISAFAAVFDWITIMNYDVWGSSSTPGPNAPLSDGCGNSLQPLANAYAAVNSWNKAGMPLEKIVLGTAAYGYLSSSSATKLVDKRGLVPELVEPAHRRSWGSRRHGHADAVAASLQKRAVTITNDWGGTTDGQIPFQSLVNQGALTRDSSGNWVGAGGFTRLWDSCSSTPFLRSPTTNQVVTYDDPDSLSLKGQFALAKGLGGVNVWESSGDYDWVLIDALRSGLGI